MNPCFCVLTICVCVCVCLHSSLINQMSMHLHLSYTCCRNLSPNNCKVVKTPPPMLGLKPTPTVCKVFENSSYAHGNLDPTPTILQFLPISPMLMESLTHTIFVVYSNLSHYARERLDPRICILYPTLIMLVVTT